MAQKKYRITFPLGIYDVEAENSKEAIDVAIKLFKEEFEKFIDSGEVYRVPALRWNRNTKSHYDSDDDD